jgi:hypothetical protein
MRTHTKSRAGSVHNKWQGAPARARRAARRAGASDNRRNPFRPGELARQLAWLAGACERRMRRQRGSRFTAGPTLTSPAGQPRLRAAPQPRPAAPAPLPRHVPHRNARAAAIGGRGQRLLRQMARGLVARLRRSRAELQGDLPQLAAQERRGRAARQKRWKRVLNGNPAYSKPPAATPCTTSKGFGGWLTSERRVSSAGTAASGSSSAPSLLRRSCRPGC